MAAFLIIYYTAMAGIPIAILEYTPWVWWGITLKIICAFWLLTLYRNLFFHQAVALLLGSTRVGVALFGVLQSLMPLLTPGSTLFYSLIGILCALLTLNILLLQQERQGMLPPGLRDDPKAALALLACPQCNKAYGRETAELAWKTTTTENSESFNASLKEGVRLSFSPTWRVICEHCAFECRFHIQNHELLDERYKQLPTKVARPDA